MEIDFEFRKKIHSSGLWGIVAPPILHPLPSHCVFHIGANVLVLTQRLIGPDFCRCIESSGQPWNFKRQAKWREKLVILHWKFQTDDWRIFFPAKLCSAISFWDIRWLLSLFDLFDLQDDSFSDLKKRGAGQEILDDLKSNHFLHYVSSKGYHH